MPALKSYAFAAKGRDTPRRVALLCLALVIGVFTPISVEAQGRPVDVSKIRGVGNIVYGKYFRPEFVGQMLNNTESTLTRIDIHLTIKAFALCSDLVFPLLDKKGRLSASIDHLPAVCQERFSEVLDESRKKLLKPKRAKNGDILIDLSVLYQVRDESFTIRCDQRADIRPNETFECRFILPTTFDFASEEFTFMIAAAYGK